MQAIQPGWEHRPLPFCRVTKAAAAPGVRVEAGRGPYSCTLSAGGIIKVELLWNSHHIRAAGLQVHNPWCSTHLAGRRERHGGGCILATGSHWGSSFSRLVFFLSEMRVQQIPSLALSVGEREGVMERTQGVLRSINWTGWLGGRKKCQRKMRDSGVLPLCHHAAVLLLLSGSRIKFLCVAWNSL